MKDTKKILGKYISNFIFIGIIIGAITFFGEMILINNLGMKYPSLVITLIILIFVLTTFLLHMIVANRTIKKAILTEEKKKTLTKTLRVTLGIICLIVMFVDYFAFVNINKSFINTYRNTELEQLKAVVAEGEETQQELDETQARVESDINTVVYVLGMLAGAYLMKVTGIIVFHYIALFISILFGVYTFSARNVQWSKIKEPERKEKKNFMSFSILTMLSNAAGQLTYILDVFIIGFLIKDLNILASYKTATIIPFALTFIPISIMIFVYPYFVEHARDVDWVKKNYKNLLLYNGAFNLAISLFLIIFSKLIIRICFGEQYIDTLYAFIILSAGYFISASFRIPAGNILAALGKVKINLYITIIAGILQIILDVVLILNIGSIGAAISSLCIFVFTGMLNNILLYRTINGQVSHNNQASI